MSETFKGTYQDLASYKLGDFVEHKCIIYCCLRSQVEGCPPPDRDVWKSVGVTGSRGQVGLTSSPDVYVDVLNIYLIYIAADNADWDETDAVTVTAKDEAGALEFARNGCGPGALLGGYTIDPQGSLIVKCIGVAAPEIEAGLMMGSVHGSYRRSGV